jgi:transposase
MEPTTMVTDLDVNQVEEVLTRIEQQMGEETVRPLRLMFTWCLSVHSLLQEKDLSITRLRRMVFGPRTERTEDIFPDEQKRTSEEPDAESSDSSSATTEINSDKSGDDQANAASESTPTTPRPRRRPAKGHGRIPASAYTGCDRVILTHECYGPGDSCPHCQEGTLYRLKEWAMTIRLVGQPPVGGVRYEQERLRCGTCGEIEAAKLPDDVGEKKYDPSVAAVIGVLRYGEGMPWTRIERIQRWAGIPLPSSVQWELVRDAAKECYRSLFKQLCFEAAQGELIHNDDTTMRVLELNSMKKEGKPLRADAPERVGVYTTGILSMAGTRPTISLFFTGPRHSGENLHDLLNQRLPDLPDPIQMCDAISHNMPHELKTIVANCLSHGRERCIHDVLPCAGQLSGGRLGTRQARWGGGSAPAFPRTVAACQSVVETFTQVEYAEVPTPAFGDRMGQFDSDDVNRRRRAAGVKRFQFSPELRSKVPPEQRRPFMGQDSEPNGSTGHGASPRDAITIKPRDGAQRVVRAHAEHGGELPERAAERE